jgi:acyl-coenzyme A synthetase/AMP-(fatty) acid ligase
MSLRLSDIVPKARNTARAFFKLGLVKGDVVHIALPNTTEIFFPVLGSWLCQAIPSMVDPYLKELSCAMQFEDSNPKLVICHKGG